MVDALERYFRTFENLGICDLYSDASSILDKPISTGWTCLHFACYYGHREVIHFLLTRGANVNIETLDAWTPLLLATHQGNISCVELLLSNSNTEISKLSPVHGSALHLASKLGHEEIVVLLLQCGAKITSFDTFGRIPLELTTRKSIIDLIPKFMGQLLMARIKRKDRSVFPIEETDDEEVPPPFCGFIQYAEIPGERRVYLFLDADAGVFRRYVSRDECLDLHSPEAEIRLRDVLELEQTCLVDSEKSYFVITHKAGRDKYFSEHEEVVTEWHRQIRYALELMQSRVLKLRRTITSENPQSPETGSLLRHKSCSDVTTFAKLSEEMIPRNEKLNEEKVMLQNFEILDQLGCGSFGEVFRVRKRGTGTIYALKVLNKQTLLRHHQLKYAISESQILHNLDFPFIIKLHYRFQTPKRLYLILEYCPNGDLTLQLDEKETFPEDVARFYIAEIILALNFLHENGIVYRDLKPDNVLLDEIGHIRLTDFGLAKEGRGNIEANRSFCGSPAYLAPEMLLYKCAGQPADVYGVGAVLYEFLTGKPPYYSDDIQTLFSNIKGGKLSFPWDLSIEAKELLKATLAKEPGHRPTIKEIMGFKFFQALDWEKLARKEVKPPEFLRREEWEQEETEVVKEGMKDKDYSEMVTMEECLVDFD